MIKNLLGSKIGRIVAVLLLMALITVSSFLFMANGGAEKILKALEERRKEDIGPLINMEGLIVNIAGTEGQRYLKASFSLEIADEKGVKELNKIMVKIQDRIITILSSQTLEELEANHREGKLKGIIAENINQLAGKESVKNVYFTEFVMQ